MVPGHDRGLLPRRPQRQPAQLLPIIDPDFKVNDAYPMRSLALCEAFVASIVRALAESPQWKRSLLLITVRRARRLLRPRAAAHAPSTCAPTSGSWASGCRRWPSARRCARGAVVSTPLEHVSVAATLRARFGIESLSERMDATADISGCIDPARLGVSLPPPLDLPPVELPGSFARPLGFESSQPEIEQALADRSIPEHLVDAQSTTSGWPAGCGTRRSWTR